MERQLRPQPVSCVAKNSQRPASVETVQGGVPPYRVKETLVVNDTQANTETLVEILNLSSSTITISDTI